MRHKENERAFGMKKVIVIGCPGAGKTTFSEKLRDKSDLPLFYLDAIWHKVDKTHITRDEFDERLGTILAEEAWIIDGHYSRTLERRIIACDTVFLFDLPTEICLAGVSARIGKKRPDMPWIDTALDPRLKSEVEAFRETHMPAIYDLLDRHKAGKSIVIFKSRAQADAFLESAI